MEFSANLIAPGIIAILATALSFYVIKKNKATGIYLCDNCRFNSPEKCQKAERPYAQSCTSYRVVEEGR
jgi:hypothetical protein